MLISFNDLRKELFEICILQGYCLEKSEIISTVIAESTLDGVYSHGVNRFSQLINLTQKRVIDKDANPILKTEFGSSEIWDGCSGPGITNAAFCMDRAIYLARENGMGFVSLSNTNHWLRGGSFGWQAANAGMIGICFTNTKPNMPPWGGKDSRIGNNPLVVAIPHKSGHIVLDMALSQYSFGKIHKYKLDGEKLPFPGGFDKHGNLTNDPVEILKEERGLPIGYWKGSGLSIMLDLLVSLLSGGDNSNIIGKKEFETGLSQVFICWDPQRYTNSDGQENIITDIIDSVHEVDVINAGDFTYYPGEKTKEIRKKQLKSGIIINDKVWEEIIGFKTS